MKWEGSRNDIAKAFSVTCTNIIMLQTQHGVDAGGSLSM